MFRYFFQGQEEFEESESVNRRGTDNTIAKIKRTKRRLTIYKTYT